MLGQIWQDAKDKYAQPFRADMSATDWFLFIGLLMVIMILWRIILAHILEG